MRPIGQLSILFALIPFLVLSCAPADDLDPTHTSIFPFEETARTLPEDSPTTTPENASPSILVRTRSATWLLESPYENPILAFENTDEYRYELFKWSPTGDRLAYARTTLAGIPTYSVWVSRPDGTERVRVTREYWDTLVPRPPSGFNGPLVYPSGWSSDGTWLGVSGVEANAVNIATSQTINGKELYHQYFPIDPDHPIHTLHAYKSQLGGNVLLLFNAIRDQTSFLLVDLEELASIEKVTIPEPGAWVINLAPDGSALGTEAFMREIQLLDLQTRQWHSLENAEPYVNMVWSFDSQWLAWIDADYSPPRDAYSIHVKLLDRNQDWKLSSLDPFYQSTSASRVQWLADTDGHNWLFAHQKYQDAPFQWISPVGNKETTPHLPEKLSDLANAATWSSRIEIGPWQPQAGWISSKAPAAFEELAPAADSTPSASPQFEKQLLFTELSDSTDIFTRSTLYGEEKFPLIADPAINEQAPLWSPDGEQIAYIHNRLDSEQSSIWIADASGLNQQQLTGLYADLQLLDWQGNWLFFYVFSELAAVHTQAGAVISISNQLVRLLPSHADLTLEGASSDGETLLVSLNNNDQLEWYLITIQDEFEIQFIPRPPTSATIPTYQGADALTLHPGGEMIFFTDFTNLNKDLECSKQACLGKQVFWRYDLRSQEWFKWLDYEQESIFSLDELAVAPNGKWLAAWSGPHLYPRQCGDCLTRNALLIIDIESGEPIFYDILSVGMFAGYVDILGWSSSSHLVVHFYHSWYRSEDICFGRPDQLRADSYGFPYCFHFEGPGIGSGISWRPHSFLNVPVRIEEEWLQ